MFIPILGVLAIVVLLASINSKMPDKPRPTLTHEEWAEGHAKMRAWVDREVAKAERMQAKAKRKAEGKGIMHWILTGE